MDCVFPSPDCWTNPECKPKNLCYMTPLIYSRHPALLVDQSDRGDLWARGYEYYWAGCYVLVSEHGAELHAEYRQADRIAELTFHQELRHSC